jgi:hypothetical protein
MKYSIIVKIANPPQGTIVRSFANATFSVSGELIVIHNDVGVYYFPLGKVLSVDLEQCALDTLTPETA